jgi:hypothetical protein
MGDVVDFLRVRFAGKGFDKLTPEEIAAIQDFMLLWSAFEAEMLQTNAGPSALVDLARNIGEATQLELGHIAAELAHFRGRYWQNGAATEHAADLRLNIYKPQVEKIAYDFLDGTEKDPAEVLAGLLLVIYRLRNNMFHGPKWAYGIQGQFDNFSKASSVLTWVLSL